MASEPHAVVLRRTHKQHDDEKRELQQLNETMGLFVRRVKDLEEKGHHLRAQVEAILKGWDIGSNEIRRKFDKDLGVLRKQLDTTTCNMLLAQIQAIRADSDKASTEHQIGFVQSFFIIDQQRLTHCAQEFDKSKAELASVLSLLDGRKQEIERSKAELKRQLDYIQNLNREFDNELMSRVVLEIEIQTMREELVFVRAIFEEQRNEFMKLGSIQLDITQFYREELTRAVSNIKKDFELLAQARNQELEDYYRVKIEQIHHEIAEYKRKKAEMSHSTDVSVIDVKVVRSEVEEGRKYLTGLRSENTNLSSRLKELEQEWENMKSNALRVENSFSNDYSTLQGDYLELQTTITSVHEGNVSLQFEINTYRRLLEGVTNNSGRTTPSAVPTTVARARDIALVWVNSATADFSISDVRNNGSLMWSESHKVQAGEFALELSVIGPRGCSGVSFRAIYYTSQNRIIVDAEITDLYNFNNYGQYQITLYYPSTKTAIGTWSMNLEPKLDICLPKQFIIRDSVNELISGATVMLRARSQVVFNGKSNGAGVVDLPRGLQDGPYEIEIDTHNPKYKVARFIRIAYRNRGTDSITYFIYRQLNDDEVEFLLKWGQQPKDLDSHVYVSDGRHVYFSNKVERNVSLDYDCRSGSGPETIRVKLEPGMKYVYAVHRYSKDGELAKSEAVVTISSNGLTGTNEATRFVNVPPLVDHPSANFWIVCAIDGTSKRFKFFPRGEFEDRDECGTDSFMRKYLNSV